MFNFVRSARKMKIKPAEYITVLIKYFEDYHFHIPWQLGKRGRYSKVSVSA